MVAARTRADTLACHLGLDETLLCSARYRRARPIQHGANRITSGCMQQHADQNDRESRVCRKVAGSSGSAARRVCLPCATGGTALSSEFRHTSLPPARRACTGCPTRSRLPYDTDTMSRIPRYGCFDEAEVFTFPTFFSFCFWLRDRGRPLRQSNRAGCASAQYLRAVHCARSCESQLMTTVDGHQASSFTERPARPPPPRRRPSRRWRRWRAMTAASDPSTPLRAG